MRFELKQEEKERIKQEKLNFVKKVRDAAQKNLRSYKFEQEEKRKNQSLLKFTKSLDFRNLIKEDEDIKNVLSLIKEKVEQKETKGK